MVNSSMNTKIGLKNHYGMSADAWHQPPALRNKDNPCERTKRDITTAEQISIRYPQEFLETSGQRWNNFTGINKPLILMRRRISHKSNRFSNKMVRTHIF